MGLWPDLKPDQFDTQLLRIMLSFTRLSTLGSEPILAWVITQTLGLDDRDHTTLASAYASGAVSLSGAPPNIIKPVVGFPMPHGVKTCIYYPFRVPSGSLGGALTSGLTFELLLAMHPNANDADLSGTVAYFDFVGTKINASSQAAGATTNTPDDFMFSTTTCVAAATAALPTAVSRFHVHSQAVTNAALNTPAVGEWILVRIRRLGDHQLDTNVGSIVVVAVTRFAY